MIKVRRQNSPRRLSKGLQKTQEHCSDFDRCPIEYEDGNKTLEFDQSIYGHASVKKALIDSQHKKCCFCEAKFLANTHGDVEHYRPKGAIKQDKESDLAKPGYYWLAYTWNNLYWCCPTCNRTYKKNFFPLRDPTKRARSPQDCLEAEEPLILDPGGSEDPRDHIEFRQELAIGKTCEGRTTVEVIGLNRADLWEERHACLAEIKIMREILTIWERGGTPELKECAKAAELKLRSAVGPEAKFSAMVTDYLS